MIIMSDNAYFRIGLSEMLSLNKNRLINNACTVIYDRGDGNISIMPLSYALSFKENDLTIFDFLSHDFITLDSKAKVYSEIITYIKNSNKLSALTYIPNKRKLLSGCDTSMLELLASGLEINDVVNRLPCLSKTAIYARKNKALRKIGVPSFSIFLKLRQTWDLNFNYQSDMSGMQKNARFCKCYDINT